MRKRIVKSLWMGFLVVLWGLVFGLFLEGTALLYQLHQEGNNPLIAAYRVGQPLPAMGAPMAIAPVKVVPPDRLCGWDTHPEPFELDAAMERVLSWGPSVSGVAMDIRDARRESFFGLTPDAREAYARLRKELVLVFDVNGRLLRAYGSDKFFFEGIQWVLFRAATCKSGIVPAVYDVVDAVLASGQEQHFTLSWPNSRAPIAILSAACIPVKEEHESGEAAGVFISLNPDEITAGPAGQVPEDSRWVAPHFRFKPRYQETAHPGFTTNSQGFRDAERKVPKSEGTFRILCVGGSTTQEGDTNATTYPALLETRLCEVFPERIIEVVDAGIPGISTPFHLLRLSDYRKLEPDLVIMHLGVNDTLLKYNVWLVNALPSRLRSARWLFPSLAAPSLETFRAFQREYMVYNLELMSVLFQQQGAAVAFASIAFPEPGAIKDVERAYYTYQGQYTWQFPAFELGTYAKYIQESNALLKETAAAVDGIYIPVAENLHGGTSLFTDFCHLTQEGIQAKADLIFDALYPVLKRKFTGGTEKEGQDKHSTVKETTRAP